jgi:hypothetical protein
VPSITINDVKIKQASANTSIVSNLSESSVPIDSNVRKQYVIENVGHFKYLRNNNIVIYFIDKVKLHMDEYSLKMYLENDLNRCSCCIFLPDNSQHDIQLGYVNFSVIFLYLYRKYLKITHASVCEYLCTDLCTYTRKKTFILITFRPSLVV